MSLDPARGKLTQCAAARSTAQAQGLAERIDVTPRTRDDHLVLRFRATLVVPAAGEWTFTCGSDDGSWLWIDDQLVVANAAIMPHRRKHGTVKLDAGTHGLRVVFSEAAGGQSLEVLWRGPGREQQPIPKEAARASSVALVPPALPPRGRSRVVRDAACSSYARGLSSPATMSRS